MAVRTKQISTMKTTITNSRSRIRNNNVIPNVTFVSILIIALLIKSSTSFSSCKRSSPNTFLLTPIKQSPSLTTRLYYTTGDDNNNNDEKKQQQQHKPTTTESLNKQSSNKERSNVIPLIGPIPLMKPLLLGGSMTLNPPTPLQWKALEESVVLHYNYVEGMKEQGGGGKDAVIDAAPLVAVIDEVSGLKPIAGSSSGQSGRYATLAAVVGITNNDKTSTESDFYNSVQTKRIVPLSSSIRLVGVGRAIIQDLFYRTPTTTTKSTQRQEEGSTTAEEEEEDDDDEWEDDGYIDNTPIVMAEFRPLFDDRTNHNTFIPDSSSFRFSSSRTNKNIFRGQSSEVHAISALNEMMNKVNWMHDERRKLVRGLQAAKSRLELAKEGVIEYDDYDGLGFIGGGGGRGDYDEEYDDDDYDDFMESSEEMDALHDIFTRNINITNNDESTTTTTTKHIQSLENYGLDYYGTLTSIPTLTQSAIRDIFSPYYSQRFRSHEAFFYEMSSFVAFRVLESYASQEDLAWALACTSSLKRLIKAYELMLEHRIELEGVVDVLSKELKDCGEECEDLW